MVEYENKHFYLDGAHTIESINICADWFEQNTKFNPNIKCLIFNATGDRDFGKLLKILNDRLKFDYVFFVPNISLCNGFSSTNSNFTIRNHDQLKKCNEFEMIWKNMNSSNIWLSSAHSGQSVLVTNINDNLSNGTAMVLPCVVDVLKKLNELNHSGDIDVLVTGSLHLVGSVILSFEELNLVKNLIK